MQAWAEMRPAFARRIFFLILFGVVSLVSTASHATEREDAVTAAKAVMAALAEKNFALIWDKLSSDTFKKAASRDTFVSGFPELRQKIGPLRSSNIVHVLYSPPRADPKLKETYSVVFENVYATGLLNMSSTDTLTEQIVLIEENGQFKMLGWALPLR
jgi:hypothetical protein